MTGYDDLDIKTGGKFLRIKGGESVDIHILDEKPVKKVVHWINGNRFECGGEGCLHCEEGIDQQERWITNVLDRRDNKVKLFEFGPGVAIGIQNIAQVLSEDGHSIHSVDLRISATGSGKGTKYSVVQKMATAVPENLKRHPIQ